MNYKKGRQVNKTLHNSKPKSINNRKKLAWKVLWRFLN